MIEIIKYDTEQGKALCDIGLSRKDKQALRKAQHMKRQEIKTLGIENAQRLAYASITEKHNRTYTGEGMLTGKVSELILAGDVMNEYTKPMLPLERALLKYKR